MYESTLRNSDFDDLYFDGEERLITRGQRYFIDDNIVERLSNG